MDKIKNWNVTLGSGKWQVKLNVAFLAVIVGLIGFLCVKVM